MNKRWDLMYIRKGFGRIRIKLPLIVFEKD